MWQILLSPDAQDFLNKTERQLSERIKKRLRKLKENPFYYLEHFEGHDYYKLRIGKYRALIDVDSKNKILRVRVIDHRSRIYKRKH